MLAGKHQRLRKTHLTTLQAMLSDKASPAEGSLTELNRASFLRETSQGERSRADLSKKSKRGLKKKKTPDDRAKKGLYQGTYGVGTTFSLRGEPGNSSCGRGNRSGKDAATRGTRSTSTNPRKRVEAAVLGREAVPHPKREDAALTKRSKAPVIGKGCFVLAHARREVALAKRLAYVREQRQ